MAWQSQTLLELIQRVEQDFSSRFFGQSGQLRRSSLKILARVWAGLVFLTTLLLEWIYRNGFAHLCDSDQVPYHGIPIGVYQKAGATASGNVAGTGTPGATIFQGEIIQTVGGDFEYQTTDEVEIDENGEFTVEITSLDIGSDYNRDEAEILEFQTTTGVRDDELVVQSGGIQGADDIEDLEDLRARILYKKRNPPQGGAESDYVIKATSYPNVTQAYIREGIPQVNNVQVVLADYDKVEASDSPPIVAQADVDRVQDGLTDPDWKPLTSQPVASSCIISNVTVKARIRPYSSQLKESVVKNLKSLMVYNGVPDSTISDGTVAATILRTYGITEIQLDDLIQDGVPTDTLVFGWQNVGWLESSDISELA